MEFPIKFRPLGRPRHRGPCIGATLKGRYLCPRGNPERNVTVLYPRWTEMESKEKEKDYAVTGGRVLYDWGPSIALSPPLPPSTSQVVFDLRLWCGNRGRAVEGEKEHQPSSTDFDCKSARHEGRVKAKGTCKRPRGGEGLFRGITPDAFCANRQLTMVPGGLEKPMQIANKAREMGESSSFAVKLDGP
ncbi:hypothetical protein BJV77DRAFT_1153991 [Russula vinacea]|nr:hypothetical protein BJV77DRAFT_1153991 [Russula vinacea]